MRAFEVTRWLSVMDTAGKLVTVSWPSLATMLSTPARTKLDAAAWSPATFAGSRTAANVVEVSALVLDFDGGVSLAEAKRAASGLSAVWHTSWSHTLACPRFRLAVNVSRSMTPSEFAQVWGWAFARFSVGKRTPDGACKDASRVWLLPSHGGAFAAKVLTGAALDVDGVLAIPPPRVLRAPLTGRRGQVLTAATLHSATLPPRVEALLRSSLALRRLWEGVKGAGDSSRSGCDYSCVRELLRRGVSPALAFASLRLRPNVHSRDDEYLLRTVRNAFGDIRRLS